MYNVCIVGQLFFYKEIKLIIKKINKLYYEIKEYYVEKKIL